ncbi:hypothetical protein D3C78_1331090 [compost metagenome]
MQQRPQARVAIAEDGADGLAGQLLDAGRHQAAADQQVALYHQRGAPAVVLELVFDPFRRHVAAHVDVVPEQRLLDPGARQDAEVRLQSDPLRRAGEEFEKDAAGQPAFLDARQWHRPAVHHGKAQDPGFGLGQAGEQQQGEGQNTHRGTVNGRVRTQCLSVVGLPSCKMRTV